MTINPYESPNHNVRPATNSRRWLMAAYAIAWLTFFLTPAAAVMLLLLAPETFALGEMPKGDSILSRISLCIGIRAEVFLPVSFLGCAIVTVLSPLRTDWKIALVVSWFPLFLFVEMFALILAIQMATGYVCT